MTITISVKIRTNTLNNSLKLKHSFEDHLITIQILQNGTWEATELALHMLGQGGCQAQQAQLCSQSVILGS